LQDELTEAISGQVNAELAGSERQQAHKKTTTDLDAWDLYQRGLWHYYKMSKDDMAEARRLFQIASEQAPEFASAYAGLGVVASTETILGYPQDKAATLGQGLSDAEKALTLDDRDEFSQYALGRVCMFLGDRDRAISALEQSIDLNPSFSLAYYGLGFALYWFGRAEEAIPQYTRAIRLSPHDPQLWAFHTLRSLAHSLLDEFDPAIIEAKAAMQVKSDEFWGYQALAIACGSSGQIEEARAARDRACKLNPELSISHFKSMMTTLHSPYLEKFLDALRKAGLPEE
jgi:tetratricopeptide (TPR) repeat protein